MDGRNRRPAPVGKRSAPLAEERHQLTSGFISTLPFTEARIRAASIYCSDGRFGEQIDEFLHQGLGLPRYDRLAVPGGPACFSGAMSVFWEGHSGERQLEFLARVHGLERLVLIAHTGCAFYLDWLKTRPEDLEAHQTDDLCKAAARLRLAHPALAVEMYLARRNGGTIWFDPVTDAPKPDGWNPGPSQR